ncbi:MAG: DoxX family membrane protein [Cellulomonadaceae bacterium]
MLLRRIARPLLATPFLYDGVDAVRRPSDHVASARVAVDRVTVALHVRRVSDAELVTVVRAHGALMTAGGLCLAAGRAPRAAALLLATLSAPLALASEPFSGPKATRSARLERFVRGLGAVGATLLAGIDLEGRPGLGWRVGNARAERAHIKEVKAAAKE